jgi:hypothetical protein
MSFNRRLSRTSAELARPSAEIAEPVSQIKASQDHTKCEEKSKHIWKMCCFYCGHDFVSKGTQEYDEVISMFKRIMSDIKNNDELYRKKMVEYENKKDYSDRCKTSRWVASRCPRNKNVKIEKFEQPQNDTE